MHIVIASAPRTAASDNSYAQEYRGVAGNLLHYERGDIAFKHQRQGRVAKEMHVQPLNASAFLETLHD